VTVGGNPQALKLSRERFVRFLDSVAAQKS
jgi:hypothetical protein